ncbi:hypothetical protein FRC11_010123, partial [Ceratobasidium sp. 423]
LERPGGTTRAQIEPYRIPSVLEFAKKCPQQRLNHRPLALLQSAETMLGLLSLRNSKELVHLAHAAGLLTYFSAGFKEEHIKIAVYSGVDGIGGVTSSVASRYHLLIIIIGNMIGISGAQVLRSMDRETGMHGEYLESRIDKLIDERDTAAQNVFGRAAKLLARLNQIYYEGSITAPELGGRNALYLELDQEKLDEISLESKLNSIIVAEVLKILEGGDKPWTARARRLFTKLQVFIRVACYVLGREAHFVGVAWRYMHTDDNPTPTESYNQSPSVE